MRKREREREKILYLLVCYPNVYNSWAWAKPKARSQESSLGGRDPILEPSSTATYQRVLINQKLNHKER